MFCIASGGSYAAIAALTNIPAMFLAYIIYEFLLMDTDRGTSCRDLSTSLTPNLTPLQ